MEEHIERDLTPTNNTPLVYSEIDYTKRQGFRIGIEHLINELGLDTELGIADFILAEMFDNLLTVIYNTKKENERLFGDTNIIKLINSTNIENITRQ